MVSKRILGSWFLILGLMGKVPADNKISSGSLELALFSY